MEHTQYALQEIRRLKLGSSQEASGGFADTHTLLVAENGAGYLYVDGIKCRLRPRSLCYCSPGSIVDIRCAEDGEATLEWFELSFQVWDMEERSSERLAYGRRAKPLMPAGELPYAASPEALALMEELHVRWSGRRFDPNERVDLRLEGTFKSAMHELLQASGEADADEWTLRIRQVAEYMDRHFALPITRTEMARRTGLTPEHFSVSFKKVMGIGFSDYLTRLRIEKAKEALLGSDSNLNRIAREVGYRDGMYLSRKFKQQTGVSPRDYMRRPKRLVALQHLGHLLALGLTPVGTTTKLLHALPYRGMLDNVADVGDIQSLDGIAALEPDLIVTSRPNTEPLARLATTISIPWGREDCLDELVRLGQALDRTREAEQWIEAFRLKERHAAARIAGYVEPGATAVVFEFWPDKLWAVNMGYGRGLRNLYKTFPFRPPESLASHVLNPGLGLELTSGHLSEFAADYIFVSVWDERGGEAHAGQVMSSPEWNRLPAVRNGRVFRIDLGLFKYNDPIALGLQLDVQTELLTKIHEQTNIRQ